MSKILSFSTLMVLLCFAPALAREGLYLGVGAAYNSPQSSDINDINPAVGYDLKIGYNFGPVALESTLLGSTHSDTLPGYGNAYFSGFTLDLRIFVSQVDDPNQVYFLAGFGSYSIDQYNPLYAADTTLSGSGFDLGAGLEHYLSENLSLNFGFTYRIIRYDEFDIGGVPFTVSPEIKGNTLTLDGAILFHF